MKWMLMLALVGCAEKITAEPLRVTPDASPEDPDTAVMQGADSGPQERAITVTMVTCPDGGTLDVPGKLASDLVGTTICAHHKDGTMTCPHPMNLTDGRIDTTACSAAAISPADYVMFAVPR